MAARDVELHRRAIAEYQRGNVAGAVVLLEKCLRQNPNNGTAFNDLGIMLATLQRYDDALASYDRALAINPLHPEALNNRGSALNVLGRDTEALSSFDRALALRPNYADALNNRGFTLHKLRRYDEALASYDRALRIQRDLFHIWISRGHTLMMLDRHEDALASFERGLRLPPRDPAVLLHLADTLVRLNQVDGATACCQQLLARHPDHLEARISLCMAQLPILYMSEPEIERRRARYEAELRALAGHVDRRSGADLAGAFGRLLPFYLPYQGRNDRALQSLYGSLFCRVMAVRFPAAAPPKRPAPTERVRVGIVSAFFCEHSNWKIPIKGWVGQLDRDRFQLFGYHVGARREPETESAAGMCDRFVQGLPALADWRAAILADAPHVLIFPEIGMDRITAELAAQRLAPVQCSSWGHPDTSGFPTIDYFLSSDLMEPPDAQDHYTERLIRLPNLSIYYEPADERPAPPDRGVIGLRRDAPVFWCGQALFKYLPQFDDVFPRIAREVPDCQFVFVEADGVQAITALFRRRLAAAFAARGADSARHCVFLQRLSMRNFAAMIGACDVILDSIGWSGCNSTLEALPYDLPIVTMTGAFMRGRHTSAILNMMGVTETVAATVDDYVAMATRLANDNQWRAHVSARMAQNRSKVYRDRACIAALESFLDEAARTGKAP